MKLISIRTQIRDVAEWYINERYGAKWDSLDIHQRLLTLDVETATAEEVSDIIGNRFWVESTTCDECGVDSGVVIELGEERDFDGCTAMICPDCITKAGKLISNKDDL